MMLGFDDFGVGLKTVIFVGYQSCSRRAAQSVLNIAAPEIASQNYEIEIQITIRISVGAFKYPFTFFKKELRDSVKEASFWRS
jgi:hypothetical protein